jgi:AsmA protein
MVTADAVEVALDLPALLRQNIVFPELRLRRPVIFLEQGSGGRKNWLLDLEQQDEDARITIGRLLLDEGTLGYDDAERKTSIRAELSTSDGGPTGSGLNIAAQGKYQGQPIKLHGKGGPVLALRDESTPYPLQGELSIGRTVVKANGSITSLLKLSALDLQLAVRGASLAQLFPLLGIAFPETGAYATEGHMVRSGQI